MCVYLPNYTLHERRARRMMDIAGPALAPGDASDLPRPSGSGLEDSPKMAKQAEPLVLRFQLLRVEVRAMRVDPPALPGRMAGQTILLSMTRCTALQSLPGGLTVAENEAGVLVVESRRRPALRRPAEADVTATTEDLWVVAGGALVFPVEGRR